MSLAVPRQGHVLSTVAEKFGAPIRTAVRLIKSSFASQLSLFDVQQLYGPRISSNKATGRTPAELVAWNIVSTWVVGFSLGSVERSADLADAEQWFLGEYNNRGLARLASRSARREAQTLLAEVADEEAFSDLLPYILDPHGQGSRLSVRRRPETAVARNRKRAEGVYYTPQDVAAYMAVEALRGLEKDAVPLTVLDPACGTGVFLRAALAELERANPKVDMFDLSCSCLYGTDIDPWVLDATAYVLLHDCFAAIQARGIAPLAAWHALRLNLAQIDALLLTREEQTERSSAARLKRLEYRTSLKAGCVPEPYVEEARSGPVSLREIFPELADGPRIVIGNPPYANVGDRRDLLRTSTTYETLRPAPRPTAEVYPLFVEQMIRLTAPNAHGGAMVLPLSLACNTGPQFVALRNLIARTPGHWRFAFFDREPHALFGEDVKTRNAIVLWTRHGNEKGVLVSTGPLRKWRGHSRGAMFDSISFTPVQVDIRLGIPKVEGNEQAVALDHLFRETRVLSSSVLELGRTSLARALSNPRSTLHVGATAYNFLNVFFSPSPAAIPAGATLTENPLHALQLRSEEDALCVFAMLSSHLAFWWWHVHGDGFHVSRRNLESFPIGMALTEPGYAKPLAALGRRLWEKVNASPIVSLNRGRLSLGFSPLLFPEIRKSIDQVLVLALGLDSKFVPMLQNFTETVRTAQQAFDESEV